MRNILYTAADEPYARSARWSLRLGVFCIPVMAITLGVIRGGYVELHHAFAAFICAAVLAGLGLALGVLALAIIWVQGKRGLRAAAVGIALSALTAALPLSVGLRWVSLPAMHDIATDVGDPPEFILSAAERSTVDHPLAEFDPKNALAQLAAFPEVQPVFTAADSTEALALALDLVRTRKWRMIGAPHPPSAGGDLLIEAVARTGPIGMRSDVIIRIRPVKGGAKLDMRSASRQGSHDLGANAALISLFLSDFQDAAK